VKKNDPKKNKNMCCFSRMIFSSYWTDFSYFSSASGRTCQQLIFLKGGVHGFIYFSLIFFSTFYFLTTQKWCMEITPKYTITIINTLSMLLKGPGGSMNYVVGIPNNSYKRITNTSWVGTRVCKLQKRCTRLATASDKVYQLLAHSRWFSPGTPAYSTTRTGRHDIVEILLKVALNTINKNHWYTW
jgi:hypothetical protein